MIPPPPRSTLFPYTTLFRSKGLGAKEWNNSLKTKLSLLPKKLFRIRMSRNFLGSSDSLVLDRKSGSAGMPRPISYAVFCLKKKKKIEHQVQYDYTISDEIET